MVALRRHTPEQIIAKLREARVALAQGHRWRRSAGHWGDRDVLPLA